MGARALEQKLTSTSFRELKETQGKEGKDAESLRKELQEKEAELKEKNRLFLQLKDDFEALKKTTDGGSNGMMVPRRLCAQSSLSVLMAMYIVLGGGGYYSLCRQEGRRH